MRFTSTLVLLLVSIPAFAQLPQRAPSIGPATDYIAWDVSASPYRVMPGDTITLLAEGHLSPDWKMYAPDSPKPSWGAKFEVGNLPDHLMEVEGIIQDQPESAMDPNFGIEVRYFTKVVKMAVKLAVAPDAPNSEVVVQGNLAFQLCNDELRICLAPARDTFSVPVAVRKVD